MRQTACSEFPICFFRGPCSSASVYSLRKRPPSGAYGSNKEAARLSGIRVRSVVYGVYIFCSSVCGVAGILLASRLGNGVPNAGTGYELDAIAAAVVGGASLDGGEGSVIGAVLGAMIMATLRQGGTLLGINSFIMEIIIGSLIVIAVVLDKVRKKRN